MDDDAEGVPRRRLRRRVRAAARQEAEREHEAAEVEGGRAGEERRPAAEGEVEPADRRTERHTEVRRDANRRVGLLVPVGRDEVGDHRLARGASDLEEEAAHADESESDELAPAGAEEAEDQPGLTCPREQDQGPTPEVVGEVAADVARRRADDRADQEGEADRDLARVQPLDRPDPDEAPDGRAAQRPGEGGREHRAQRPVDVGAPDEAEQAAEEAQRPVRRGRRGGRRRAAPLPSGSSRPGRRRPRASPSSRAPCRTSRR